jgi:hypothetical protein
MQHPVQLFLIEEAVGREANNQRCKQRRPSLGCVGATDDSIQLIRILILCKNRSQIGAHRNKECSPDKKLEEHHDAELDADGVHSGSDSCRAIQMV